MADQNHIRAEKTTTYFAASGVVGTGLWVLGMAVASPLFAVAVVAGSIALATTEKGRGFLNKLGDQLLNLGSDTLSHLSEDYNRGRSWWQRRSEAHKAAKAAKPAPAPQETSTFNGLTQAPGFNKAADPAAEAAPAAAPAPAPTHTPKAPTL